MKLSERITPGPWKLMNGKADSTFFPSVILKGDLDFANDYRIVVNVSHDRKMDSIIANAEAIAAVPEMLALLEKISECRFPYQYQDVKKEIVEFLNKLNN